MAAPYPLEPSSEGDKMSNTNKRAFKQHARPQKLTIPEFCDIIGYHFSKPELIERALMHSSVSRDKLANNERLEFLGDRVVGLVVAKILFDLYPLEDEGTLAIRHSNLVSAHSLMRVGEDIRIDDVLKVSLQEAKRHGQKNRNVVSDAVEAVVGAVYVDAGFDAAYGVVERIMAKRIEAAKIPLKDYKTRLQEYTQKTMSIYPVYEVMSQEGPSHAPTFTVRAVAGGIVKIGTGSSRKEAEQMVAMDILGDLGLLDSI